MTISRPEQHLNAILQKYPDAPKMIDRLRAHRGTDLSEWPSWCFLPMAGWQSIVMANNDPKDFTLEYTEDIACLAALGTWRYSQGIYRINPDMMEALVASPMSGKLPSEVFYRLPEWCIYVETPGTKWMGDILHGFWVFLERDVKNEQTELRFMLDCGKGLFPVILHLGAWTIVEALDRVTAKAKEFSKQVNIKIPFGLEKVAHDIAKELTPLMSILLYICSDEPEIDNDREPGVSPERPRPKKTKKGWRLFPPSKPRIWSVGEHTGETLRCTVQGELTGRTVKPHLRRGHWHGYWTGPRQGERKFIYRWIKPIPVGC